MTRLDPEFSEAFARSLGLFLASMRFEGGVEVRGQRIIVRVTDDLVVSLDVRAARREPSRFRRAVRRRHLTLLTSPPTGDEAG